MEQLQAAIDSVRTRTPSANSRAATYLRTYPALLATARCDGVDDTTRFLQLATMAYGWMPRVLRLDLNHLDKAIIALRRAWAATEGAWDDEGVGHLAAVLCSVVGASRLLHFANPQVFPIWAGTSNGFTMVPVLRSVT